MFSLAYKYYNKDLKKFTVHLYCPEQVRYCGYKESIGTVFTHLLKVKWVLLPILALRRAEAGGSDCKASRTT